MSLQGLLVKISVCLVFLFVLIGCQQSPSGAIIVETEPDAPKHVVVSSIPVSTPEEIDIEIVEEPEEPVIEPVIPEPEVIIIPEDKPSGDPVADCLRKCTSSCEISAKTACSQSSGSACKHLCGNIIDPSACSTACSLRSARICQPKMVEFCTSQCNSKCY